MYPNLKAEIARNGLKNKELAKILGISESTFSLKLNGKFSFTLREAGILLDALHSDMDFKTLFYKIDEKGA